MICNIYDFRKSLKDLNDEIPIDIEAVPLQEAVKKLFMRRYLDSLWFMIGLRFKYLGLIGILQLYRHRHIWRYRLVYKCGILTAVRWI